MVKTEPPALVAGVEAADVAPVRPAASAVGSHNVHFSPSHSRPRMVTVAQSYCTKLLHKATAQSYCTKLITPNAAKNAQRYDPMSSLNPSIISCFVFALQT